MSVPQLVSLSTAVDATGSAPYIGITTPGARANDILIILAAAYGPTGLDVSAGFTTGHTGAVSLGAATVTTYGTWDFAEQTFVVPLTAYNMASFVNRPVDMGAGNLMITVAVVRGAVTSGTWYEAWETTDITTLWPSDAAYYDPTETVADDALILSVGHVVGPALAPGPMVAGSLLDDTLATTVTRAAGAGGTSAFALRRPAPEPGTQISWTLTPTQTLDEESTADGFGIAHTFYLPPGVDRVTYPTQPAPQRLSLVCAQSYSAWITDRTYEDRIDQIPWTSLTWNRVLDDVSKATVSSPDNLGGVYCVAAQGGLVPWKYGLVIERNDREVWKGPIRSVSRPAARATAGSRTIEIEAVDIFGRYEKLPLIYDEPVEYEDVDSGQIFRDIIVTHSASSANGWTLLVPVFNTNSTMSRVLRASDNQNAWEVLKDILDASADVTVINGEIYAFDPDRGWLTATPRYDQVVEGPYNIAFDLVYGLFTSESFVELPGWSISGANQGNFVAVAGSAIGQKGFAKVHISQDATSQDEYGVLLLRDQVSVQRSDADAPLSEDQALISRADSILALHSREPAVISGGILAEGAPINVASLIPGSIWNVDIHDAGYGQLLQQGRLKQVDVTVRRTGGGLVEEISPTLHPVGYEAGLAS